MHRMTSVAGHFGELLQGRMGKDGPVALISLPCPVLRVTAMAQPARHLALHSPQNVLSLQETRRFLHEIAADPRIRLHLRCDMPPGGGAGASTASLTALAKLCRPDLSPMALAQACLKIEGATDPLMFHKPERLLWASRRAHPLANLSSLPRFEVLGGFWGTSQRTDAHDSCFADISDLVAQWSTIASVEDLAELTSESARRNLVMRAGTGDPVADLAQSCGALGYVIAHTGTARGFLFAPGQVPPQAKSCLKEAGYSTIVHFAAGGLT